MTNDKELVDVWRAEFVSKVKETKEYEFAVDCIKPFIFDVDSNGKFKKSDTETLWQGFLMSKRSQSSVVLPNPISVDSYMHSKAYVIEEVHAALTAAGIKYTIGE